jgi:ketosteroid isomerase-like protein
MTEARTLIQSIYDAFARGDIEGVLGSFAPDIEWLEAEGNPMADGNPYDSPARVGEAVFGRLVGLFDGYAAVPETVLADGAQVAVFGRYRGTHRESGQRLDAPFVHHWTVADGKVSHFRQYTDTAQMVRLLG